MDDVKSLITRFYDTWNERDRDGWLACCNGDITFTAPGGLIRKSVPRWARGSTWACAGGARWGVDAG